MGVEIEEVDGLGKSVSQIEKDLLDNHDAEQEALKKNESDNKEDLKVVEIDGVYDLTQKDKVDDSEVKEVINKGDDLKPDSEINDDMALSFLKKKFNREDLTYDSLLKVEEKEIIKEVEVELDPMVASFKKFKEETGRGMRDYLRATRDISKMSDDEILSEHISLVNPEFDNEDVRFEMEQNFAIDEDMDDEIDIRKKTIEKKRKLAEARSFLSEYNEKYKSPLESSENYLSKEDRELLARAKDESSNENDRREADEKRKGYFSKKTNELFSDKFKGFEFNVSDGNSKTIEIDVAATKDTQMSALNFINSHLDENGMLKDAKAYHKAMYAATHADEIFKHAYELGAAEAIEAEAKEAKNINMGKKKPESGSRKTPAVQEVSGPKSNLRSDGGLRITRRK